MKKTLATITTAIIVICMSFTAVSAGTTTKNSVKSEMQQTAAYMAKVISERGTSFTDDRIVNNIIKSGIDSTTIQKDYLTSLKAHLDENNGKMMYTDFNGTKSESAGYYANAIQNLKLMGKDPKDFNSYNLVASLKAMTSEKVSGAGINLYLRCYTLEAVEAMKSDFADTTTENDLITSIMNDFLSNETGDGYDNYGVSVDNGGKCIPALMPYYNTNAAVKEQLDKAISWIKTQSTDDGYNSNLASQYNSINADSTALALCALTAFDDDEAKNAYTAMLKYKTTDASGGYAYQIDSINEKPSLIATTDALSALVAYYGTLPTDEPTTTEPTTNETTTAPQTTQPTTTTAQEKEAASIPATGTSSIIAACAVLSVISGAVIVGARKKKS